MCDMSLNEKVLYLIANWSCILIWKTSVDSSSWVSYLYSRLLDGNGCESECLLPKKMHQKFPSSSSLLTLLNYLELFINHFITAIENIRFEIYFRFIWIQTYRIVYFSRRLFAKHHTISSWCRIFSSRSISSKFRFYLFQSFLFIVVIVISILLKTAFWQTSIHNQSLLKIL